MPLWDDDWESAILPGYTGTRHPLKGKRSKKDVEVETKATAAGDAPKKKKEKEKEKNKENSKPEIEGKNAKKDVKVKGKEAAAVPLDEVITDSFMAREEAEARAQARRRHLCKKRWPEVTKVKISTKPWSPPGPPEKMPRVMINYPRLKTEEWTPPYLMERAKRPPLPRMTPDAVEPLGYELSKNSKRVWHNFCQVDTNKMMIQGKLACNSKRYKSNLCGAQTGCIALACRALLDEKSPAQLISQDVDDCIRAGDLFYKQCMQGMLCYKGKAALPLRQLKSSFFFNGKKFSVDMSEIDRGILAKSPDNVQGGDDLMALMEKRAGSEYMGILTVGDDTHFLIWGHPPIDGGGIRTACYIFDPHMYDQDGFKSAVAGAGVFLRYAGVSSFVLDFVSNYGNLKAASKAHPKPPITITAVEIISKSRVPPPPGYSLDLAMLRTHCRSEWEAYNMQVMQDEKRYEGKWPLASLSAETLNASRKSSRRKVDAFYQKGGPKEPPPPPPPVMPEKAPPPPTVDQLMSSRGEDFFLYAPKPDAHLYGRDDMVPYATTSEKQLFSPVDFADQYFQSQFSKIGGGMTILRGTRHFASYRYQTFKWFHGIACCVVALGMLRRLRGRAWNEDTIDATLDNGWNFHRESLMERRGPIRRLVLGELKKTFSLRDVVYKHKERGVAVWGKIISRKDPKVYDVCRGLEQFFKEADSGILQIPGEIEMAIWFEGKKYYMYHPWPADKNGNKVSLQGGGKACVITFPSLDAMCEHFVDNVQEWKRKPFSISDVRVYELGPRPEPINDLKPIGSSRWGVRGTKNEADESFPEANRGKQATPASICAIAMAQMVDPATWTEEDIDEILKRGDILYEKTMEHLDKLGINFETPAKDEENEGEEEEVSQSGTTGTLAAADVLPRFRITEFDCIETEIQDSLYSGQINPEPDSDVMSLKDSLAQMFKKYNAGVVTARGGSMAVFKHDNHFYFFDPHGCDENGLPSDEPRAAAVLIRMQDNVKELADVIMGNLPPGNDDSFNLSPVEIISSKLNPELGAPEIKQDSKQHEWIQKNTATILMGPRGQSSALGKAATKCSVGDEDLAGRLLALPAAAAFCASADVVPPPAMHQDHMFNFIDAGANYYLNHVKKTGRKDITVDDFTDPFEMGANTFTLEIGESTRLPLRLPDKPAEGGEEEGEGGGGELGEGEEPKEVMKEMKDLLFKIWYDTTKPTSIHLLLGDYHQLGLWMSCEGKVVVFDAAPTLAKGLLTPQRIAKGDELRLQRIKDEMAGEGEEDDAGGEEGGEEEKPEPEPEFVPPESCPVLMTFASPAEFIDRLVLKTPLDKKQMIAPYWLYPVTVTNELTSVLKEKKPGAKGEAEEEEGGEGEDSLVEPLDDEAIGKHFKRASRTIASVRGCVRQDEQYFLENPNRNNQDAANAIMGIVVNNIEPYIHWKPSLIDAILKYGDRLYTLSVADARNPPKLTTEEVAKEFQVTNFNVKLDVTPDVITGDLKAGDTGKLLNLARGIKRFFDSDQYGVICCKGYCVGIWKAQGDKNYVLWDPHGVGPMGKSGPESAAGLILFSTIEEMAETIKYNIEALDRALPNKFTISAVKVAWELTKVPPPVSPPGAVPDEGYEWKVLTAFVEFARGRTILRGSRPGDITAFARDAVLASAASAVVAACMSHIRRPHLWTRKTVDEIMSIGCCLFNKSISNLGYEFRPGEDILLPLQVLKRFQMGVNYVRYNLEEVKQDTLELKGHHGTHLRAALGTFFESHTHGILWCTPHAVAVWRVVGAPTYYMCEPHACNPLGAREAVDDAAAAVMTFTSPKLLAHQFLQNYPPETRSDLEYSLYVMSVTVAPIQKFLGVPPLVRPQPGHDAVSATAKCNFDGRIRRANEGDRRHPPGSVTCMDIVHATELCDRLDPKLKDVPILTGLNVTYRMYSLGHLSLPKMAVVRAGVRNANGWLIVTDGSQYMSAQHSITCKKFPYASRGNQVLPCALMAIAMSRIQDVCHWCETTLDRILDSGDQLYQDSYLHYRPIGTQLLNIEQVLRKFYTPGNCVCRVMVFEPRQTGSVDSDLTDKLKQFFREEQMGVFDAGNGKFAVALFKTLKGFYMFDPGDRDRYGRAVAPPCIGRGRACLSQYPKVKMLADKLSQNVCDLTGSSNPADGDMNKESVSKMNKDSMSKVHFSKPSEYKIYGVAVSTLRRLNQ